RRIGGLPRRLPSPRRARRRAAPLPQRAGGERQRAPLRPAHSAPVDRGPRARLMAPRRASKMPSMRWLAPLLLLLVACDAPPAERPAARRATSGEATRVVAIGDLHGDLSATRAALRLAGAIDERDRWVGGRLVVVQTGDQLDRGDDEPEILALFERLAVEAEAAGGAVHSLLGN